MDVGITQNGYELNQDIKGELINETDAYGETIIDWVMRGGDVSLIFESKAYKVGSITPFFPNGAQGVLNTPATPMGRLASDAALAMVLTATANTPAAAAPATLTGSKALMPPGQSNRLLYNSKVRNVPIRLQFLPTDSAGTARHFTVT